MASRMQQGASERLSEIRDRSQEFISAASEKSKELYGQVQEWLPENRNLVLGIAAGGLFAGFLGYRLGKSRSRSPVIEKAQEASEKIQQGFDFSPMYKLVKLWMLYRLSV